MRKKKNSPNLSETFHNYKNKLVECCNRVFTKILDYNFVKVNIIESQHN